MTITRIEGDARELTEIASNSIACIVTSPPYNCGIDYKNYNDSIPWNDYIDLAVQSAQAMHRVLMDGGRAWINVQPTIPVSDQRIDLELIWKNALHAAGFKYRDTTAWIQDSHDGACAWGSWLIPSAPNQRGGWEAIICVYKSHWKRRAPEGLKSYRAERHDEGGDWGNDLCRNVWKIKPASAKRTGFPAPFPRELPARCIRLSTWPGENILDPFGGSGTTALVANDLGRNGIYVELPGLPGPSDSSAGL